MSNVTLITAPCQLAEIAELGERQTEDLKVPGSNTEGLNELSLIPGLGNNFCSFLIFRVLKILNFSFKIIPKEIATSANSLKSLYTVIVAISFGIILKETLKHFRTRKMRNEQILLPGPGINQSSFEPSVFEAGTFRSSVSRSPN